MPCKRRFGSYLAPLFIIFFVFSSLTVFIFLENNLSISNKYFRLYSEVPYREGLLSGVSKKKSYLTSLVLVSNPAFFIVFVKYLLNSSLISSSQEV